VILLPREVVPGALCREFMVEEKRHPGMTWDEIRQTSLDAGMNRNSCLMEWSRSGIDHKFIRMIMGEDTPSNPMRLIPYWRAILPGFSSMALSYFHSSVRPDSELPQFAYQAVFDCFLLIDVMRTMLDLTHRDNVKDEGQYGNELPRDEQILQSQEQLEKEYGDDDDEALDDIDSLDIQVVDKEVMEAMTDQEQEIVDLFQKYLNIQPLPSSDKTSGPTSVSSVKGSEDDPVNPAMDEEKNGAYSRRVARLWTSEPCKVPELGDVLYNIY
jgi:hypothetical protein